MKKSILVIMLVLILSGFALAQGDEPEMAPVDLPIYPGGEPGMEINLSNKDILPMINASLSMLSGKIASIAGKLDPQEIAGVFKDVAKIQALQLDVADKKVSENDVVKFYSTHLPNGKWSRLFWQREAKSGSVAIYCQPGCEALYGFRVRVIMADGVPVKRVEVAKIDGKIDFAKLILLASKTLFSK